ncbi:SMRP1 protein, partial [Brachypteracias leptosomus]|nr:SMRP1 protein [Brachypteracias leptosomus]
MFLFSKNHKTPVSTYTDSYRPPCSIKRTLKDKDLEQTWKENKFVTKGLTMPLDQNPASQVHPKHLITAAMQEYYRNTIDPSAYRPWKYWLDRSEEKYNPVFVNEDKYMTWKMGPYNSAAWNKHSSCLPLPPKETRMESFLQSKPTPYAPKLTCINQFERDVVGDMLPVYTVMGRAPLQSCYSPCPGRHYCLRGMDYSMDGTSAIRRHLHSPGERAVRSIPCCSQSPRVKFSASTHHPHPSSLHYPTMPRWSTSHFTKIGGVQKGSFIIHPEFASEAYSVPRY